MKQFVNFTAIMAVMALAMAGLAFAASPQPVNYQEQLSDGSSNPEQTALAMRNLTSMPLAFTENQGQWDEQVLFRANAGGATMLFTATGACYQFTRSVPRDEPLAGPVDPGHDQIDRGPEQCETIMIKATFVGANPRPDMVGVGMMEYKCNYFLSNDPAGWRTDLPNYNAVVYQDIYSGIDLKYYGNGEQMEYDFIVSPGADMNQIEVRYEGAQGVSVNAVGELEVETDWGRVVERRPLVYQVDGGIRRELAAAYAPSSEHSFRFVLHEPYNRELPLVIDPVISYSTYVGGSGCDYPFGIAIDTAGNAYVAGWTTSSNFPAVNAYDPSYSGDRDVFVTKLSADGSSLLYSTYLGSTADDWGLGIAVDAAGSAYVTGRTGSTDFPTVNAYDPSHNGDQDIFVTKLAADGGSLLYSTYLGGSNNDECRGIAVDAAGSAYITGHTASSEFPVVNAYDPSLEGARDIFVTKLSAGGGSLLYSTFLSGNGWDEVRGIAVDAAGSAYVTGWTWSTDFPTVNAYDPTFNGDEDVFVTKLAASGSSLLYSTYLGGTDVDWPHGIAVDTDGSAFVTGETYSSDFPTANAYDPSFNGGSTDVFVSKLSASGGSLLYSTYLGGSSDEIGRCIAVDTAGSAYVSGRTQSSDFSTANAYDPTHNGNDDVFLTKLSAGGSSLLSSTYLGGSGSETGSGIAVDSAGSVFVTGWTSSSDFPTANAYDPSFNGCDDVFMIKLLMNVAPVLDFIGDKSGPVLVLLSFTATASDADIPPQTLTFSLADGVSGSVPPGAEITPGGDFTWTPTADQGPDTYTFDVVVTDGEAEDRETITVEVTNVAPVLDFIGNKVSPELVLLSFTATASDADIPPQTLTFSLEDGASGSVPLGAEITPGGDFTWTPTADQGPDTYTFDVVVTDGAAEDRETITVEVNEPPVIISTPVTTAIIGQPYGYSVIATGDPVPTYALVTHPSGMTIDAATGLVLWLPLAAGDYDVTVEAINSSGTDTQNFSINVTCCVGLTGNVDNDPSDIVDLGDLTKLIDYLFISFEEPECMEEANIDGSVDGIVDLGDLTRLIDYLFISFTPPAECQ